MNHTPSGSLLLSKAIPGFKNHKTAEGLSPRMIDWVEHLGFSPNMVTLSTPILCAN